MNYSELVDFLIEKPSYLKEGSRRLSDKTGLDREDCRKAVREARDYFTYEVDSSKSDPSNLSGESTEKEDLELKSIWQSADGSWLKSYKNKGDTISSEKLEEIFKRVLKDSQSKQIYIDKQNSDNEKGLFVWTADKHIGASVDESIYDNPYNEAEFMKRLGKIVSEIKEARNEHGKFNTLFLADLGDCLDGMNSTTVRGGHELDQNMSNEDQIEVYIRSHKQLIDLIVKSDVANNIVVWNVSNDNHSGSFGYAAQRAFEEYIQAIYPDIEVYNQTKFMEHYNYGVHNFILTHGKDTQDRQKGLPLNLDEKTESYINEYIDYHDLVGKIHLIKGDLHRSTEHKARKFRYKNCPSIFGSSKWIHNNFGYTKAACDMEVVYKNKNKILSQTIELQ